MDLQYIRSYGDWLRKVNNGRRDDKSIFGEEPLSKKTRRMNIKMVQKAFIYNLLLNAA